MASSSTSFIHKSFKYDVFLSFRGEDTRKTFVDHLYHALQQKNIHTYKDDERIKKGRRIGDELIKSIEDSRFHIIVFSKNYASSSWCLDELVKIMECQKTPEQTAYPIFYDVEPSEVRKQSGEFGRIFAKHENKHATRKWREALEQAAVLAGWELKTLVDGHEAKFIQKIVEEISLELRSVNFIVDGKLVGMETRVKDVVTSLEIGVDDVRIIGIKGIGGGGKTTLARAIFDQISPWYEGKSFVENVREASKTSLPSLQKQVLSDTLNDQSIFVSSVYDGKILMKKMMSGQKVIVVLDDVDHVEQLKALAGELNWFKPGSRIIVTTRDEQVLIAHRVNLICDINLLSRMEAICLFSRSSLTITVLGSFLCGKNMLEWKDALKRLETIPLKETLDKLELSYVGLEEDYKEIFLDVACILKGWRKNEAIIALESCGFHARIGLRVLEQKSLITIDGNKYLGMHDHIEEMGKNIVRRLHPHEPYKHSRLWIDKEIKKILANNLVTRATSMIMYMWELNPEIVIKGLGNMKKLRFLHVNSKYNKDPFQELDEVSQYFPDSLRYLTWNNYPFQSLPKTFQANNLVVLRIHGNKIAKLWEGRDRKVLNKLRLLDISYSMLKTLDLGLTPNLDTLALDHCQNLLEIHSPVECLKLIHIGFTFCKFRTLDFRLAPNLETLVLDHCKDLVELHIPIECQKLLSIKVTFCEFRILDLRLTPNLKTLYVEGLIDFVELHMPVECLKLKSLHLDRVKWMTRDLGRTPNLERLKLVQCVDLVERQMPVECLNLMTLDLSHSKLRTLDLELNPNLEALSLRNCYQLVELHRPIRGLKNLVSIQLDGCLGFTKFSFVEKLRCLEFRFLEAGFLSKLYMSTESLDICPLHSDSNSPKFQVTSFLEELVPSSIGGLENTSIGFFHACINLVRLSQRIFVLKCVRKLTLAGGILEPPKKFDRLECLQKLSLSLTEIKHLPDNICTLKHLKTLKLKGCCLLEKLPEDLGRLECLEDLLLQSCEKLQAIPYSICKMKRLIRLNLKGCVLVDNLPKELGYIECLQELDIEGTSIGHLPLSIILLEGLHIKGSRLLHYACTFSFDREDSVYDTFYHRATHSKSLLRKPDSEELQNEQWW
ncbi:hypothetical protein OSB04_015764, partial [Centaurea solstitialis]